MSLCYSHIRQVFTEIITCQPTKFKKRESTLSQNRVRTLRRNRKILSQDYWEGFPCLIGSQSTMRILKSNFHIKFESFPVVLTVKFTVLFTITKIFRERNCPSFFYFCKPKTRDSPSKRGTVVCLLYLAIYRQSYSCISTGHFDSSNQFVNCTSKEHLHS